VGTGGCGVGSRSSVEPRQSPFLGPAVAVSCPAAWLNAQRDSGGAPSHHHMPTCSLVHQSLLARSPPPAGTLENRHASPDALRGEPAFEILVRSVPSAPSLQVVDVMGLLPQTWESKVVSHGMTRARQPGKPPAASRQSPPGLRMLVRLGVTPKAPGAKQAEPAHSAQRMDASGSAREQLPITTASPSFGGASTPGVGGITHAITELEVLRGVDIENLV
jgi:hypothetical protein